LAKLDERQHIPVARRVIVKQSEGCISALSEPG
jgi:hypothetical protein